MRARWQRLPVFGSAAVDQLAPSRHPRLSPPAPSINEAGRRPGPKSGEALGQRAGGDGCRLRLDGDFPASPHRPRSMPPSPFGRMPGRQGRIALEAQDTRSPIATCFEPRTARSISPAPRLIEGAGDRESLAGAMRSPPRSARSGGATPGTSIEPRSRGRGSTRARWQRLPVLARF